MPACRIYMARNSKKSELNKNWKRWAWVIIFIAIFFVNRGFRLLTRNWLELHKINAQKALLSKEIQDKTQELKQLSDPSVLELKARKELDFIKRGEIEYRFTPPNNS